MDILTCNVVSDLLPYSEPKCVFFKEETYTTLEETPLTSHYCATAVLPPSVPLTILEENPEQPTHCCHTEGEMWRVLECTE